ncbi:MAG: DUF4349 domain-containing protein [Saprospiraceae bacterium]
MKNLFLLIAFIFLVSCHSQNKEAKDSNNTPTSQRLSDHIRVEDFEENIEVERVPNQTPSAIPVVNVQTPSIPRQVIKNADYKLQVEDLDQSTSAIHKLAETHGAFVSGMNLNSSARLIRNTMTIRVPNQNFDPLLEAIAKQAIFTNHKRITSQDVTEEFVDIQSRLKVKKEIKSKYEKMLRDDAKSLTQIFDAEEKIRVLQEEIEAKEGRLRYLSNRVSLSEIKLEIYQQVEYQDKLFVQNKSFFQKSKESFLNGWGSVQTLLLAGLDVWPALFLFGLVWVRRSNIFDYLKTKLKRE